jgi:hypothetical protein
MPMRKPALAALLVLSLVALPLLARPPEGPAPVSEVSLLRAVMTALHSFIAGLLPASTPMRPSASPPRTAPPSLECSSGMDPDGRCL